MRNTIALIALPAVFLSGCEAAPQDEAANATASTPHETYWHSLQALCGRAYEGRLIEAPPGDTVFTNRRLVMHVRQCNPTEIRIPFHVGDNHSRTWILTRLDDGFRLKHDHRHADGSEDEITQYGGETRTPGTATAQEFPPDEYTVNLIPETATNFWTVTIEPGERFVYALRREGTDRRVRVEFDLLREVEAPAPPWGY